MFFFSYTIYGNAMLHLSHPYSKLYTTQYIYLLIFNHFRELIIPIILNMWNSNINNTNVTHI